MANILVDTAFNAFYDGLTRLEKGHGLVTPTVFNSKKLVGRLSEAGAATDYTFNEDYSTTSATFASYLTTAACAIHQLKFQIGISDFDETGTLDPTLWLGGTAALNPGIIWGVGTSGTVTPATYGSAAATTIQAFTTLWGADVQRNLGLSLATNNLNTDTITVTLDFKKMFGHSLLLASGVYIGLFLNENLSADTVCTTFSGLVTGVLI